MRTLLATVVFFVFGEEESSSYVGRRRRGICRKSAEDVRRERWWWYRSHSRVKKLSSSTERWRESDLPLGGKVAIGFVTQQQRTRQLNMTTSMAKTKNKIYQHFFVVGKLRASFPYTTTSQYFILDFPMLHFNQKIIVQVLVEIISKNLPLVSEKKSIFVMNVIDWWLSSWYFSL